MKRTAVFLVLVAFALTGCRRNVMTFEIPDGYTGWVTIKYNDAACKTSSNATFGTVVTADANGKACASVDRKSGTIIRHFYYIDSNRNRVRELKATGWGQGGQIWAEVGSMEGDEYKFFVGTEQQYQASINRPYVPQPVQQN